MAGPMTIPLIGAGIGAMVDKDMLTSSSERPKKARVFARDKGKALILSSRTLVCSLPPASLVSRIGRRRRREPVVVR
mgnify:CR=1 FL=1